MGAIGRGGGVRKGAIVGLGGALSRALAIVWVDGNHRIELEGEFVCVGGEQHLHFLAYLHVELPRLFGW